VRNPVLLHRVRLFSLVPLVWESNPILIGRIVASYGSELRLRLVAFYKDAGVPWSSVESRSLAHLVLL